MSSLFEGLNTFNEDISGWKVGNVTNMNQMFFGATSFSGNVSSWDVSSVTNMREMFKGASSFNGNLCAWKDSFPYSNAADIFADSGCTLKYNPSSAYQGPFCASYCDTISPSDCFTTRDELKAAVDRYVQGDWGTAESSKNGWPIGSWCVGNVTDMSIYLRVLIHSMKIFLGGMLIMLLI
jgi:surface protein